MKKYLKTAAQGFLMLALAFICIMQMEMQVKAEYVNDTANGVSYDNEETLSVGYAYDYAKGAGSYVYIYLSNAEERIANVKSSSKYLLAKKTYESYSTSSYTAYGTNEKKTTNRYSTTYISFFAKKAGTYTVTFDVVKADGTVKCTKSIKVKAGSTIYESPVKTIKYAGKDLVNYYPYTTKTSGKLSVTMKKGYKLVSIEVGKTNSKGQTVYKKVKNNKKITLSKKVVYTTEYSSSSGAAKYTYDKLFPATYIRITYKNTKTKAEGTYTTALNTINKKQSW